MFKAVGIFLAAILILITAYGIIIFTYDGLVLLEKPFPGFFVLPVIGTVNSAVLPYWSGAEHNLNWPQIITEINGKKFVSGEKLMQLVKSEPVGTKIRYGIYQGVGEKEKIIIVPTMIFVWRDFLLTHALLIILSTTLLISGILVFVLRPNHVFSWGVLIFSTSFAMMNSLTYATSYHLGPFFNWIIHFIGEYASTGAGAYLFHLSFVLFEEPKFFKGRPWRYLLLYFIALLIILGANLSRVFGNHQLAFVFWNYVGLIYSSLSIIFMVFITIWTRYKSAIPIVRQRARLLLLALSVAGGSGAVSIVLLSVGVSLSFSFSLFPSILFPIAISYGVLRYNLFEVDEIVKRSILYVVILSMVGATYAIILLGFNQFLDETLLIFIILFLFIFVFLKSRLLLFLDKVFFRSKVDYARVYREVGEKLSIIVEEENISRIVKEIAINNLFLEDANLLLLDEHGQEFKSIDREFVLKRQDMLIKVINERDGIISWDEILNSPKLRSVRARSLAQMAKIEAAFVVPICFRGRLIGLVALGRRKSKELTFNLSDVNLLSFLAQQTATALENARLYNMLRNAKVHLEKLNMELERKVIVRTFELEKRTEQLIEANRNIKTATKHKSAFLANMSHELRTPLNGLLGYVDIILEGGFGEITDSTRQAIIELKRNGKNLLIIINDLLDFSKIEADKMELRKEDFSAIDFVEAVVAQFEGEATQKGLIIKKEYGKNIPIGFGDIRRVEQILGNLISNAVKFTKKGKVIVRVGHDDKNLLFEIEDTGIGIPKNRLDIIFEEFEQLEKPLIKEYKGTGLGLALCQRMIEMHGGRIHVKSEKDKGSTFSFSLPLKSWPS